MSGRSIDEARAEANQLMEAGERERAKAILRELLDRNPPSENLYEDVIHNYLLGGCYAEAKELARRYEHVFGERPTPELSLGAIEEEERKQEEAARRTHAAGGRGTFRRLSMLERGGFPRYLPWSPTVWQEVRVEAGGVVLKKRLRSHRLGWGDVRQASLTKERSFYTEHRSYVRKLVILETRDGRTYKVDVSTTAPEIENPKALERAIRKHLPLEEGEVREWDESRDLLGGMIVVLVVMAIALLAVWALNSFS